MSCCYSGCYNFIATEKLKLHKDISGIITYHCNTCGNKYNNVEIPTQKYIYKHSKENTIFAGQTHEQINDTCIKYNVLKCNIGCKYYYLIPQ